MSKQNIDPAENTTENDESPPQPKRCADVTQTNIQPCSLTNSGTQTVCIPETLCPAPVCNQDEDCHDLYCTSETCKDEKPQEKSCCPTDDEADDENLDKSPSKTEQDTPKTCCKNKRGSIGQLKKENSNHIIKKGPSNHSALKQRDSNHSQVPKTTRWAPDTSMGSCQIKNAESKVENDDDSEDEGSTCPRKPESDAEKPPIPTPSVEPKNSGPKCTEFKKCKSDKCSKNNQDCPCHFPPAFSQYSCTGKISGNCSCAKYK